MVDHAGVSRTKLELIGNQFMARGGPQKLNLPGMHIAHAKCAHFSAGVELVKCRCHLLRFKKRVGSMQQQHVELLNPEVTQGVFD